MSQKTVAPLHLEWVPGYVRAINIVTGETAEAETVAGLGPILNGQKQALVGIGPNHIFLKALRLPRAAAADLRSILGVQIGQLFPLPADQLSFDFVRTDDQTPDGWLTLVGAIRSVDLKQVRAEIKQAGLTPLRIMPISLAAGAVVARTGRADGLVVERGPSGLSFDVVQAGILRFRRVAPAGGDPLSEAEKTLAAARAEDLPMIAGAGVDLPGSVPSLDTTLGVLHEAPPFNFELSEDRVREARQQVAARTRLAFLMITSALLLVLLVWADRQDALKVVKHSQGVWARQLTTQESIQNAVTAQANAAAAAQATLRRAFQPAQPLSDISAVVDDNLGPDAWLTGLTLERGKPLDIRGTTVAAGDVTRLVDALSASPRFRNVRLVFANSALIGKVPVVQFDVSAVCVGNLPLPAPATPGRGATRHRSVVMINFRDPQFRVPSVLILLSILILAGTLLYMVFVPPPSVAGLARGRAANLQEINREIASAKSLSHQARQQIRPMVWTGDTDTISGSVLELLTAQAQQQTLSLSAFRPQRTQDVGGVTELPFTVQLSGPYQGVHGVMAAMDAPGSKLVLNSAQIASSATGSGVTATLGLTAYVLSDGGDAPSVRVKTPSAGRAGLPRKARSPFRALPPMKARPNA